LSLVVLGGAAGLAWWTIPRGDGAPKEEEPASSLLKNGGDSKGGAADLARILQNLDQKEPGWKTLEMEGARKVVAPDQNSALVVIDAHKLMGRDFPMKEAGDALATIQPPNGIDPARLEWIRTLIERQEPALRQSRRLALLPYGRYPIQHKPDGFSTLLPHFQDSRELCTLLALESALKVQEGNIDFGLGNTRIMIHVCRTFWDDPISLGQIIQGICRGIALRNLEWTLSQGKPSDLELTSTQESIHGLLQQPTSTLFISGTRALNHDMFTAMEQGTLAYPEVVTQITGKAPDGDYAKPDLAQCHALLLNYFTRFLEIDRLPPAQRDAESLKLEGQLSQAPGLVKFLVKQHSEGIVGIRRWKAIALCSEVGCAMERFRLAKGSWPETLQDLVPTYLSAVPLDPIDGEPLRMAKVPTGRVIYSLGPDKKDNRGTIDLKNPDSAGTDWGFRLWDEAKRPISSP